MEFDLTQADVDGKKFSYGPGCRQCGHLGFKGRLGLYELLEVDDEIRDLILDQATMDEIQENAVRNGMLTMRQDGLIKISEGLSSFDEVAKETPRAVAANAYEDLSASAGDSSVSGEADFLGQSS